MKKNYSDFLSDAAHKLAPDGSGGVRVFTDDRVEYINNDVNTDALKSEITVLAKELQTAYPLQELRQKRNRLLAATDWRDLPSYAGTRQAEWRVYRQALRDITAGLDTVEKVNAATFPTQPS